MKSLKYFDWLLLIACSSIGLFHLTGVFIKVDNSPWGRHLLFTGICFFIAYAWVKQFKILPWFIGVLFIQQCTTHGVSVVKTFQNEGNIDWKSITILLMLIVLFIRLILFHRPHKKPHAI